MSTLSRDEVAKLANLARIEMTEDERKQLEEERAAVEEAAKALIRSAAYAASKRSDAVAEKYRLELEKCEPIHAAYLAAVDRANDARQRARRQRHRDALAHCHPVDIAIGDANIGTIAWRGLASEPCVISWRNSMPRLKKNKKITSLSY